MTVHKWLGDLDSNWQAGKYYQVGFNTASDAHNILNSPILPTLSDKEILQQLLNGLFEQNKLPDPTTIVECFDDDSAHSTVLFVGEFLSKAASGSISDLLSLKDTVQKFSDSLPKAVKDCLDGNEEFTALGEKYGIKKGGDMSIIEKKVISYLTLHYLKVHKWLG